MESSSIIASVAVQHAMDNPTTNETLEEQMCSALRDPGSLPADYSLDVPGALFSVEWKGNDEYLVGVFDSPRPFNLRVARDSSANSKLPSIEVVSDVYANLKDKSGVPVYEKKRDEMAEEEPRVPSKESTSSTKPLELKSAESGGFESIADALSETDANEPSPHASSSTDTGIEKEDRVEEENKSTEERKSSTNISTDKVPASPTRIKDLSIQRLGQTILTINSQQILDMIQSVVKYYPQQALAGNSIEIREPFSILLHYYPEFAELVSPHLRQDMDQTSLGHRPSEQEAGKSTPAYDFAQLINFMKPKYEAHLLATKRMMADPSPAITFDLLWYLFKPGLDVYVVNSQPLQLQGLPMFGAVVYKTTEYTPTAREIEESTYESGRKNIKYVEVHWWCLGTNGEEVGRWPGVTVIGYFEGERDATSLPIFPSKVWDSQDGGTRRKSCIETGRLCYEVIRAGSKELVANGLAAEPIDPMRRYRMEEPFFHPFRKVCYSALTLFPEILMPA